MDISVLNQYQVHLDFCLANFSHRTAHLVTHIRASLLFHGSICTMRNNYN